jgi:HEAT repeat protein
LIRGASAAERRRCADRVALIWDEPGHASLHDAVFALVECDPDRARRLALERLGHADPEVRRCVVWGLAYGSSRLSTGEADALLSMLADPNPSVRAAAANSLLLAPDLKARSIPLLRERLGDEVGPAYEALCTLTRLDPEGVIPDLERALSSKEPLLRFLGVAQLAKLDATNHARPLIAALCDDDRQVRDAATRALPTIKDPPVDALVAALDRVADAQRYVVIQALGSRRSLALSAVPALEKYAKTPGLERTVSDALGAIRGERR